MSIEKEVGIHGTTRWTSLRLTLATICVAALALAVAPVVASDDGPSDDVLASIDRMVTEFMDEEQVPGTAVAIHHRGEWILRRGWGLADVENGVPVDEHTVFRIGSVTKQFTAAAIVRLEQQGELSLDDDIGKYLPEYPTGEFHITVGQLLDHTAGIKGYTEMPTFWEKARLDMTHEEMMELFGAEPFEFEPGERWQYSNSAYYLAGVVIEKASGKSYAEYLEETFFEPLGLDDTHYLYNDPIIPRRAEGYRVENDVLLNDEPLSMLLPYAAGSLGSSAHDLVEWTLALAGGEVVGKEGFSAMITARELSSGEATHYGLGLGIGALDGHRKISHGGGINGFLTALAWYPDDQLVVTVLQNSTSGNPGRLESRITRAVLGLPEPSWDLLELPEEELRRYVGTYDMGRNKLPVLMKDGGLAMTGQPIFPIGDHRFVSSATDDRIVTFQIEDGEVVGLRIEHEGVSTEGSRVAP